MSQSNPQNEPQDTETIAKRFNLPENVFVQEKSDLKNNLITSYLRTVDESIQSGLAANNIVGIYELVRVVRLGRDGMAIVESPIVETNGPREMNIY